MEISTIILLAIVGVVIVGAIYMILRTIKKTEEKNLYFEKKRVIGEFISRLTRVTSHLKAAKNAVKNIRKLIEKEDSRLYLRDGHFETLQETFPKAKEGYMLNALDFMKVLESDIGSDRLTLIEDEAKRSKIVRDISYTLISEELISDASLCESLLDRLKTFTEVIAEQRKALKNYRAELIEP